MEIVLNSNFSEISYNEMELIEGGGWREFGYAMGGTLLINCPLCQGHFELV